MLEVIKWISIVLMWGAVGLNLYAAYLQNRLRKYYEMRIKVLEARIAYEKEHCVAVENPDDLEHILP